MNQILKCYVIFFLFFSAHPLWARPNPFYPLATQKHSDRLSLKHPFKTYSAVGFVKGPDETLVVLKNREDQVFYLSLGQDLGQEQFRLSNILKKKKKITFVFTKKVHDLTGQLVTLKRFKELTRN